MRNKLFRLAGEHDRGRRDGQHRGQCDATGSDRGDAPTEDFDGFDGREPADGRPRRRATAGRYTPTGPPVTSAIVANGIDGNVAPHVERRHGRLVRRLAVLAAARHARDRGRGRQRVRGRVRHQVGDRTCCSRSADLGRAADGGRGSDELPEVRRQDDGTVASTSTSPTSRTTAATLSKPRADRHARPRPSCTTSRSCWTCTTGPHNDVVQVFIDDMTQPLVPATLDGFEGFFAPVDNPDDAVNKAKAGQTIPLKFKVQSEVRDDLGGLLPVQRREQRRRAAGDVDDPAG